MNTRLQNHNVAIGYKSAPHLTRHLLDQAGIAEFAMCVCVASSGRISWITLPFSGLFWLLLAAQGN